VYDVPRTRTSNSGSIDSKNDTFKKMTHSRIVISEDSHMATLTRLVLLVFAWLACVGVSAQVGFIRGDSSGNVNVTSEASLSLSSDYVCLLSTGDTQISSDNNMLLSATGEATITTTGVASFTGNDGVSVNAPSGTATLSGNIVQVLAGAGNVTVSAPSGTTTMSGNIVDISTSSGSATINSPSGTTTIKGQAVQIEAGSGGAFLSSSLSTVTLSAFSAAVIESSGSTTITSANGTFISAPMGNTTITGNDGVYIEAALGTTSLCGLNVGVSALNSFNLDATIVNVTSTEAQISADTTSVIGKNGAYIGSPQGTAMISGSAVVISGNTTVTGDTVNVASSETIIASSGSITFNSTGNILVESANSIEVEGSTVEIQSTSSVTVIGSNFSVSGSVASLSDDSNGDLNIHANSVNVHTPTLFLDGLLNVAQTVNTVNVSTVAELIAAWNSLLGQPLAKPVVIQLATGTYDLSTQSQNSLVFQNQPFGAFITIQGFENSPSDVVFSGGSIVFNLVQGVTLKYFTMLCSSSLDSTFKVIGQTSVVVQNAVFSGACTYANVYVSGSVSGAYEFESWLSFSAGNAALNLVNAQINDGNYAIMCVFSATCTLNTVSITCSSSPGAVGVLVHHRSYAEIIGGSTSGCMHGVDVQMASSVEIGALTATNVNIVFVAENSGHLEIWSVTSLTNCGTLFYAQTGSSILEHTGGAQISGNSLSTGLTFELYIIGNSATSNGWQTSCVSMTYNDC